MISPQMDYLRQRRSRTGASPKLQQAVKIKYLGRLDGFPVWLVDGAQVRRLLDTDLTMGSHFAHSRFIPEGEVWVEKAMGPRDLFPLLVHEVVELHKMISGWSYEKGHDLATQIEKRIRAQDTFTLTRSGAMRRAQLFLNALRSEVR
jgi:hypothetical protein